jgi:soluble lytic murein transglycosylase-like protein
LMPATWTDMRARLGLGSNPDNPRDNILAGTCFLRLMYNRFGYPGLFGAYNAGPGTYAAWLAGNRRLPGETVAYLRAVVGTSQTASLTSEAAVPPPLFIVRRLVPENQSSSTAGEAQASLFAVRKVVP